METRLQRGSRVYPGGITKDHGRREAARWEPSRCQAVYSVDLMLVWDTGPGLESLHSVAWEAETKEGQSWRPESPVQEVWAGARQGW